MSEEEIGRGKIVIASAGIIFFRKRKRNGEIQVLVAKRQNEPWKNYNMIILGGLVDKDDKNVESTACREGNEETGGTLHFKVRHLVGVYGPNSYHHQLLRCGTELTAVSTLTPISDKLFVMIVYAAEVLQGTPMETRETANFRFINPLELADEGRPLAFDGALVLSDFWKQIRNISA